jgi:hypothetical protein
MDQSEAIKQIWETNEDLWNKKIIPLVLDPLEKSGGLGTNGLWEHILATAFGNSLKTFESIQLLTNHTLPRLLWNNAYILTREHYETFITLEWIAQDIKYRSELFFDDYSLKLAHLLHLSGEDIEEVCPERRKEIYRKRDEVLKRHSRGVGTLRLMPTLEERVRSLIGPLGIKMPNLFWEYECYYRDVSGFAHPSGWSIALSLFSSDGTVSVVEPSSRVGYNAVMLNGAWFFRILKCWNRTFRVVSEATVEQWHRQWITESGIVET